MSVAESLMKILMSAMACEPGNGSELEVGYRALLAAAQAHEVWVLTNKESIPALERALASRPEAERIHLEGIDFGVDAEGLALLTIPGFHRYYDRWQRNAAARAVELDRQVDFDVVHHVTLAAYWTRAGVAVLEKPLVWGPVGGGVEPPLGLLRELGLQGGIEDAGRVIVRRLLGRFGPARRAQRRAVITFAQNTATLHKIRTAGDLSVLTNATVIDLGAPTRTCGPRTREVFVIGRLIRWKGPMLALRAFRHVRSADARLIFCGSGPEWRRLQRAARRWNIADRVQFEGWLPRDVLLSRLATAGAVLHPALHEEAGLCLAEALALGTPVVCLDHGGPPEVLRQWPATPSATVSPANSETTARHLAREIDRFLNHPPVVAEAPRSAATSFADVLLSAYDVASRSGRAMVWGFPRGKPQLFTDSPRGLSNGVMVYAFGRRLPRLLQRSIALQVRIPGIRRLVSQRQSRVEPVCGRQVWQEIQDVMRRRNTALSGEWLHFSSQWDKQRSSFLGLSVEGAPELFLTIERVDRQPRVSRSTQSYRVPDCRYSFRYLGWSVREFEPLPVCHRPARWDPARIRQVADDVSRTLRLARPRDIPPHWLPMHGDLVPWNLREDRQGQLWLLDWEDAGWGPPFADVVRFLVAYHSLGWRSPHRIASHVRSSLAPESPDVLREVAQFWLQHRNVQPGNWPRQSAIDAARKGRESAALRALAGPD